MSATTEPITYDANSVGKARSPRAFKCAICGSLTEPGGPCNCTAAAGPDDGEEYLEALAARDDY